LRTLAGHPRVVAIGECGLDYYRHQAVGSKKSAIKDSQQRIFLEQIKLAGEAEKPLMIHCRPSPNTDDAYEDLLSQLLTAGFKLPVIVHFFVGSAVIAKKLLAAGFYFTFGGVITFVRDYDEVIKIIPLDRIMLETDAPYVSPAPYRGKRNEPAYVLAVAKKLAEIKGVDYDEIRKQTTANALNVLRPL
jgi:TatD DNase family protein